MSRLFNAADVRAARDSFNRQMNSANLAIAQGDYDKAEQTLQAIEDAVDLIEKYSKP